MASVGLSAAVSRYQSSLPRPASEITADLERYCDLLVKWNRSHNLVSRETGGDLWDRHVIDSLQLVKLVTPTDRHIADIGSGGGFPALPVAIGLKGSSRKHLLVESNSKKAAFLRMIARELRLDVTVAAERAEHMMVGSGFNVVTARAVAPLASLLQLAAPLFGTTGRGLFHKGREYDQELQAAALVWRFDVVRHQSHTDPEGVILEFRNVSPQQ